MKKLLAKILSAAKKLFSGLKLEMQHAVHVGVTIVDAIKTFDTNNPIAVDIITAIIPGDWDDVLKQKLRLMLPKVLTELRLLDTTLGLTDPQEILKASVVFIQQLDGDYKSAALHDLSIIISQVAADGKLDWSDAVYLIQWYYDHKKVS